MSITSMTRGWKRGPEHSTSEAVIQRVMGVMGFMVPPGCKSGEAPRRLSRARARQDEAANQCFRLQLAAGSRASGAGVALRDVARAPQRAAAPRQSRGLAP